jgi:DNA excision repair protein ERCC-8
MSLELQESRYLLSGGQYGTVSLTDLELHDPSDRDNEAKIAKNLWSGYAGQGQHQQQQQQQQPGGLMLSSIEWYPEDSGMFVSSLFNGALSIWDTNEMAVAYTFGLGSSILSSKIRGNESGALIAVGLGDHTVKLCDTRTGDSCLVLQGHKASVSAVDWCPAGLHQLASASLDGTMKVWDVRRGGNNPPVMTFDWLQDHTTVARYGSVFNTIDGQQSRNPSVQNVAGASRRVRQGMSSHTNGGRSQGSDGSHQWTVDRQTEQIAKAHLGGVLSMKYSPCGCFLVSAGADKRVRLWDAGSGKMMPVNYDLDVVGNSSSKLPFTMEIASFACAGDDLLCFPNGTQGDIALVPLHSATGRPIKVLRGHLGQPTSLLYRKAYHQVISAGKDGMVFLWDADIGALKQKQRRDRLNTHEQAAGRGGGAVNLELSIDINTFGELGGAGEDYWSDDDTAAAAAAAGQPAAATSSSSSASRFLPPIIRSFLDDAQAQAQRNSAANVAAANSAAAAADAATAAVEGGGGDAQKKKKKKVVVVDLRAKYGAGRYKRGRS